MFLSSLRYSNAESPLRRVEGLTFQKVDVICLLNFSSDSKDLKDCENSALLGKANGR